MLGDELTGLFVDDRVDDLLHGLGHDVAHPRLIPSPCEGQDGLPDAGQLLLGGALMVVHDVGVRTAEHRAPAYQALPHERPAERHHRRLGDDRLVEVEEGRLHKGRLPGHGFETRAVEEAVALGRDEGLGLLGRETPTVGGPHDQRTR